MTVISLGGYHRPRALRALGERLRPQPAPRRRSPVRRERRVSTTTPCASPVMTTTRRHHCSMRRRRSVRVAAARGVATAQDVATDVATARRRTVHVQHGSEHRCNDTRRPVAWSAVSGGSLPAQLQHSHVPVRTNRMRRGLLPQLRTRNTMRLRRSRDGLSTPIVSTLAASRCFAVSRTEARCPSSAHRISTARRAAR